MGAGRDCHHVIKDPLLFCLFSLYGGPPFSLLHPSDDKDRTNQHLRLKAIEEITQKGPRATEPLDPLSRLKGTVHFKGWFSQKALTLHACLGLSSYLIASSLINEEQQSGPTKNSLCLVKQTNHAKPKLCILSALLFYLHEMKRCCAKGNAINRFIMLQKIYISNKCYSLELSTQQRKSVSRFPQKY